MTGLAALHIATSDAVVAISVLLVGVLTPALIAVINHPVWQSQTKRIIAVVGAAVLGVLTVIGNGLANDLDVNLSNTITVVLAVVGASQAAYSILWKPTGAADVIETKVNPGPTPEPPLEPVNEPLIPVIPWSPPEQLRPATYARGDAPKPEPEPTVTAPDGSTVLPATPPEGPVQDEPAVPPDESGM